MEDKKRKRTGPNAYVGGSDDDIPRGDAASRARNKTVMLTPEMTGQVRARLQQDGEEEDPQSPEEVLPPIDWAAVDNLKHSDRVLDRAHDRAAIVPDEFPTPKARAGDAEGSPTAHGTGRFPVDFMKSMTSRGEPDRSKSNRPSEAFGAHVGDSLHEKIGDTGRFPGSKQAEFSGRREEPSKPSFSVNPDANIDEEDVSESRSFTGGFYQETPAEDVFEPGAFNVNRSSEMAAEEIFSSSPSESRSQYESEIPEHSYLSDDVELEELKIGARKQVQGTSSIENVGRKGSPVAISRSGKTKIVGFMVTYDLDENGEVFEICTGRWLLTSRPTDHGDYILIDDETISPLHAIIRATTEGKIQVLDQLSEYGTGVIRVGSDEEQEIAGAMITVEHGDRIRFGNRHFVICLVPQYGNGLSRD